ncbi:hypothetical protein ACFY8S_34145 [Streptomyces hygroscopicus]|uniref:hypothetical protein n=1 Tax=Streptomyces hygroscopicus TaxID=1912 RepID=UPI0036A13C8F
MANGAPGRRNCTADFKIKLVGRWLREHGATAEEPATVGIGISLDEIHRANRRRREPPEVIEYPLLDLRLRRDDCERVITEAGLPVPPKSSCFFCPFRTVDPGAISAGTSRSCSPSRSGWRKRSTGVEPRSDGMPYLTRYGILLTQAIPEESPEEGSGDEDEGACDSGWCMT